MLPLNRLYLFYHMVIVFFFVFYLITLSVVIGKQIVSLCLPVKTKLRLARMLFQVPRLVPSSISFPGVFLLPVRKVDPRIKIDKQRVLASMMICA